jgi:hypothetical protein
VLIAAAARAYALRMIADIEPGLGICSRNGSRGGVGDGGDREVGGVVQAKPFVLGV